MTDQLPIDLPRLLSELERHGVDYVIVGGIAAPLQGASRPTSDVDLLIESSTANIERFLSVCKELRMRNRTGNEKLDRQLAERAAERQWYVRDVQDIFWSAQSDAGPIDVLPTMAMSHGRVSFAAIAENADEILITTEPALRVKVASIDQLIESKEAVGRHKDRIVVDELRSLRTAFAREGGAINVTSLDLDQVADVFEQFADSSDGAGADVRVTRSPQDGRNKHFACINIEREMSGGTLIVWDSGEAEMEYSSDPESSVATHFDFEEVEQVANALELLLQEIGLR